jgi:predicted nucleic acid-binding protein
VFFAQGNHALARGAVNGHADLLVTGDGDLLALNPFRDIPIVTPATFVQAVAR